MKSAVLLLAHGTPDSPEGVPEFLRHVTGGRALPEHVVAEIQQRYQKIGHSPLTEITHRQAQALARRLDLPVYVGMRNWHPFIDATVGQMKRDGIERAVAICLAPQNSRTSTGLYRQALVAEGELPFALEFVSSWHDHPLLPRAFAARLEPAWRAAGTPPVLFTAHSVPERTIADGDPYAEQARDTAERVAAEVPGLGNNWRFAFQSQGVAGGSWTGPTVPSVLDELARSGHKAVVMQPVGFVADHVEVLYDIDIAFREEARKLGLALTRAESPNDSPLLITALADIARAGLTRVAAGALPLDIEPARSEAGDK